MRTDGIHNLELVETCGACPEQYDVFYRGEKVGYLRLRHGYFRVEYPYCGGKLVYEAEPIGGGMFEDFERDQYIREAKIAIWEEMVK